MEARRSASWIAYAIAGVLAILGAAAAIAPDMVVAAGRRMVSPAGILVAAAVRSGMGLGLLYIARGSSSPGVLRLMGLALLLAGIVMPFLGVESSRARLDWEAEHLTFLRLEGVLFVWAGYIVVSLAKPRQQLGSNAAPNA
jgi:hypothetical protein